MRILVINGPNLNMLGSREPDIYGTESYDTLIEQIGSHCEHMKVRCICFQSNHEGEIIDCIQRAPGTADAVIINPAAYTHTSIAIADALRCVRLPAVEVHISDIDSREPYRRISFVREVCEKTISGHGIHGYIEAIDYLAEKYGKK